MNESPDPGFEKLRETGWRRKLTPDETRDLRAWLAAHPEARADWESESRLNHLLDSLPDVSVPTNFTARVLQAIEREPQPARSGLSWRWFWHSLLPKFAVAALVVGIGLFSVGARNRKLAQKARSVAVVLEVSAQPDPQALQDFEAIRQLNPTRGPDLELLALMK